jgi:hypothetical protein
VQAPPWTRLRPAFGHEPLARRDQEPAGRPPGGSRAGRAHLGGQLRDPLLRQSLSQIPVEDSILLSISFQIEIYTIERLDV